MAKPIARIDARIQQLAADMAETMYAAPGIGLAATQVNVHERIIVVDVSEDQSDLRVLINPSFEPLDVQTKTYQEGCLSVPGVYDEVERPDRILVRAQGLQSRVDILR